MQKTVLVVEDDDQMLEELSGLLLSNRVTTLTAASGQESLAIAHRETFDVALLDLKLPDCDGISLMRKLKERRPGATYILMTAYGSLGTAIEAMKSGIQDYILKPFSPEEIVATIRRGFEQQADKLKTMDQIDELQRKKTLLEEKILHLRRLNEVFFGREERVQELKREINALCRELGRPPKYP